MLHIQNLISTRSLNCAKSRDMGHAHFCPLFFPPELAKFCKPTFLNSSQAISPICTKLCPQHLWTLLTKKNIKIILIFHRIFKLLNSNFLQISFQTGSVAYLHISVSKRHETQVTTSPWVPKALFYFQHKSVFGQELPHNMSQIFKP